MRRLLARVGLPMLVAALLAITNLPASHADPSSGDAWACDGPVWVLPDVSVKTCTYYYWWYYGEHHSHRTRVTVDNYSPGYTVAMTPELLVNSAVYVSGTSFIGPGGHQEVLGEYVQDLPRGTRVQGRAYLRVNSWSTYTYAPAM